MVLMHIRTNFTKNPVFFGTTPIGHNWAKETPIVPLMFFGSYRGKSVISKNMPFAYHWYSPSLATEILRGYVNSDLDLDVQIP